MVTRPAHSPAPPSAAPTLSPLQARVARAIVAHARREGLKAGSHLREGALATQVQTSRTPVAAALRHLAGIGVVSHDPNRGYFLVRDAATLRELAQDHADAPDDPLYLRIAEDRLARRLADTVNEAELVRRYGVPRSALRATLARIQQEGWAEKAAGHGWTFQPMIDTPAAYEESYVFRAALEPTGLMASGFRADVDELAALHRRQQQIVDGGYESWTAIELFEANSQFHETLARWSGNRFIVQAIRRIDGLRRLIEYRQARARSARRTHAAEHLAILDAIAANDLLRAASLMRAHLEEARRAKVHGGGGFPGLDQVELDQVD